MRLQRTTIWLVPRVKTFSLGVSSRLIDSHLATIEAEAACVGERKTTMLSAVCSASSVFKQLTMKAVAQPSSAANSNNRVVRGAAGAGRDGDVRRAPVAARRAMAASLSLRSWARRVKRDAAKVFPVQASHLLLCDICHEKQY